MPIKRNVAAAPTSASLEKATGVLALVNGRPRPDPLRPSPVAGIDHAEGIALGIEEGDEVLVWLSDPGMARRADSQ